MLIYCGKNKHNRTDRQVQTIKHKKRQSCKDISYFRFEVGRQERHETNIKVKKKNDNNNDIQLTKPLKPQRNGRKGRDFFCLTMKIN